MASQFSPGYGSSENKVDTDYGLENITEVEVHFGLSLMETCKCIIDGFDALHAMGSLGNDLPDELNINMWKALLQSNIAKLKLDVISDKLLETVCLAVSSADIFLFIDFSCFNVSRYNYLSHQYGLYREKYCIIMTEETQVYLLSSGHI